MKIIIDDTSVNVFDNKYFIYTVLRRGGKKKEKN